MPCPGILADGLAAPAAVHPAPSGPGGCRSMVLQRRSVRGLRALAERARADALGRPAVLRVRHRGVAQLAEQRSPKPQVAGSSPVAPATAGCAGSEYGNERAAPAAGSWRMW